MAIWDLWPSKASERLSSRRWVRVEDWVQISWYWGWRDGKSAFRQLSFGGWIQRWRNQAWILHKEWRRWSGKVRENWCIINGGLVRPYCLFSAVGRKKEEELTTTSQEFEFHLQFPCGSPSTELSDFRQSARSGNERECKQTLKNTCQG